ncbi:hypothetical protein ACIBL8_43130 [Streptomyces sp. NPDC050523]|uniref:hypothetical protein n=1 Tax=Streptomyces sp. NPDC050523 TaxID=3365622 RepID=UPI0037A7D486
MVLEDLSELRFALHSRNIDGFGLVYRLLLEGSRSVRASGGVGLAPFGPGVRGGGESGPVGEWSGVLPVFPCGVDGAGEDGDGVFVG